MKQHSMRFYDEHPTPATMLEEVLQGLAARPRRIAAKFFYGERGSRLFDTLARAAGLRPCQAWLDERRLFSAHYLSMAPARALVQFPRNPP